MARRKKKSFTPTRPENCLNCGARLAEQYCARCGQNNRSDRLYTREIIQKLVQEVFDFEQPLLRTVMHLTLRPGQMCLEYIGGKRRTYSNPLRYCLVMLFLFVMTSMVCDVDASRLFRVTTSSKTPEEAQQLAAYIHEVQNFVLSIYNYVVLAAIPFLALVLRLLFLRAKRNYAEHLVFAMFIVSQGMLFLTVTIPFGGLDHPVFRSIMEVIVAAYFVWAGLVFYEGRPVWRLLKLLVAAFAARLLVAILAAILAVGFKVLPDIASGRFQEVAGTESVDGDGQVEHPAASPNKDETGPTEPP